MTHPDPLNTDQLSAERWFLARGLPAVLRPGALMRHVWSRAAPGLAGFALFAANSVFVVSLSGKHSIDINGNPTVTESFVLALLVLVLPLAVLVGWLVSTMPTPRHRAIVADISIVVIALGSIYGGPSARPVANLISAAVFVAAILAMTVTGLGSVLGWAARNTLVNLGLVRSMFVRALPVVLLTFLVFFNGYVWSMASIVGRTRLWVAMIFLFVIAAAFLISSTLEQVRPTITTPAHLADDDQALAGTPFENMADPAQTPSAQIAAVSTIERINVVFVVVVAQLSQVLTVALTTGGIFLILGMIVLSPPLLDVWARGGASPTGQVFGMTLPIPNALIQTTMMLTAITFMYLAAKAVSDKEYRSQFLDPLMDELRVTLVARGRYRLATTKR